MQEEKSDTAKLKLSFRHIQQAKEKIPPLGRQ
jgi:hypothetical protein